MKSEEKLELIESLLRNYYDYVKEEVDYKDGIIDAIDIIICFDKEEEEK